MSISLETVSELERRAEAADRQQVVDLRAYVDARTLVARLEKLFAHFEQVARGTLLAEPDLGKWTEADEAECLLHGAAGAIAELLLLLEHGEWPCALQRRIGRLAKRRAAVFGRLAPRGVGAWDESWFHRSDAR